MMEKTTNTKTYFIIDGHHAHNGFGSTGRVMGQQIVRRSTIRRAPGQGFWRKRLPPIPDDRTWKGLKGLPFDGDQIITYDQAPMWSYPGSWRRFRWYRQSPLARDKDIIEQMKKMGSEGSSLLGGKGPAGSPTDGNLLMDSPFPGNLFTPSAREHRQALEYLPQGIRAGLDIRFPGHHTQRYTGNSGIPSVPAPEPDHNRIFTGDLAFSC